MFTESRQLFTESRQLFTESGQLFTESRRELRHTGLFKNGASISAFLDFYGQFDFMKVPGPPSEEKLSPEEERMIDEVSPFTTS